MRSPAASAWAPACPRRGSSSGLFNAIPEAPPRRRLIVQFATIAGTDRRWAVPPERLGQDHIGHVRYYAVLPDGFAANFAGIGCATTTPMVCSSRLGTGADEVAKLPVSRVLDAERYPSEPSKSRRRYP